jgi:outer membrane protein TolC
MRAPRAWRLPLTLAVVLLSAGCATTQVNRAFDDVTRGVDERVGTQPRLLGTDEQRLAAADEVSRILGQPVSADDAVRITVLNSAQLQSLLHHSAAAMATSIQAGRLVNPTFTFERLVRGEDKDIGRLLTFQVIDLLTWPSRQRIADARLQEDKLRAVGTIVDAAADARKAWVDAVAAQQMLRYHRDVLTAAEASAELARRMQGAGNFTRLQRAREQAFYADAVVQLARAQHAEVAAREALVRRLGLTAEQAGRLKLPDRLPDLPKVPRSEAEVARAAMDQRLDVQAAQRALETTARQAGVANVRSVLSRLEFSVARNSETNEPVQRGYEIEVPLPVFDAGDAARAEMRSTYQAAVYRSQQVIIDAHSQVRQSYHAYRTSLDVARHYRDEIVPLRKAIAEENLYRYNGMLIGVFELLADAREQVASVITAIETQRDFWLADAALNNTLIGRSESLPRALGPAPKAAAAGGGDPH